MDLVIVLIILLLSRLVDVRNMLNDVRILIEINRLFCRILMLMLGKFGEGRIGFARIVGGKGFLLRIAGDNRIISNLCAGI